MIRITSFSYRNWLIAIHDVGVTALAVVASFYLRFQGESFAERLPLLLTILPYFLVFSFFVCYVFNLTTTKWRFVSVPDLLNILRAASVMTIALLVLDYIFLAPNIYGTFFLGKTTIVIYWFVEVFFLSGSRLAYRYFRYSRTRNRAKSKDAAPTLLIGRAADAEIFLRGVESGAVNRLWPVGILSPALSDRGQLIRGIPVLGTLDDLTDVVADFALPRQADPARGDDAFGVRARCPTRIHSDAGAQARPDGQPSAVVGGKSRCPPPCARGG